MPCYVNDDSSVSSIWSSRCARHRRTRTLYRVINTAGLFEDATFGGNGRTCRTCHSRETGTVSPEDAHCSSVTLMG